MLYVDPDEPVYFVWRFMIDAQQQKKGYGKRAMQLVVEHVRGLPGATELLISYVPGEGSPAAFYEKCGFVETGKWHKGEKEMKLTLKSS
jgi:diamine N-acetyltransferase